MMEELQSLFHSVERIKTVKLRGRVSQVLGLVLEAKGPAAPIGELCWIRPRGGQPSIMAEIVGFREDKTLLMPYDELSGICPGDEIVATGGPLRVSVSDELLGRVIGGSGQILDQGPELKEQCAASINNRPPEAMHRRRIQHALGTGLKCIDGCLTIGRGQRMGIFAGSGVGKSVLLASIAKYSEADVNVIALIGERGREVRDFIEDALGEEGLKKSVLVVVTSDKNALLKIKGSMVAATIAEYFRDQGKNVMFMMDSVTRLALAQREVGLSIGEPPTTRGYTPSVFTLLPKILERAGTSEKGSITGLYAVLVEGDEMNEPIADACRAILDGHIVLSRDLASRNHYPAVDVMQSISRVMVDIVSKEHAHAAHKLKKILAVYNEAEDLINIGAYVKGSNKNIDNAIQMIDQVNRYLVQGIGEFFAYDQSVRELINHMAGAL